MGRDEASGVGHGRRRKCHELVNGRVRGGMNASDSWLRPVEEALDAADRPVRFFFRDDDAGWGDVRLIELLDLFAACSLPVDLAVIPRALDAGLAGELGMRRRVGLHQHGLAHVNHEREGRKCEFGPARAADAQRRDIEAGRARLADLLGARVDPIFTPPWNRCTADTGRCLAALGFEVLSREARAGAAGRARPARAAGAASTGSRTATASGCARPSSAGGSPTSSASAARSA